MIGYVSKYNCRKASSIILTARNTTFPVGSFNSLSVIIGGSKLSSKSMLRLIDIYALGLKHRLFGNILTHLPSIGYCLYSPLKQYYTTRSFLSDMLNIIHATCNIHEQQLSFSNGFFFSKQLLAFSRFFKLSIRFFSHI